MSSSELSSPVQPSPSNPFSTVSNPLSSPSISKSSLSNAFFSSPNASDGPLMHFEFAAIGKTHEGLVAYYSKLPVQTSPYDNIVASIVKLPPGEWAEAGT